MSTEPLNTPQPSCRWLIKRYPDKCVLFHDGILVAQSFNPISLVVVYGYSTGLANNSLTHEASGIRISID